MDFFPERFAEVALPSYDSSSCSPEAPSPDWSGVVIVAPQRIVIGLGEQPSLPICGYFLLPALSTMDGEPLALEIIRADDGRLVRRPVIEPARNEFEVPPPDDVPQVNRDELIGVSIGGYFNIDAQHYLPFPLMLGVLEITVTYAGARSNRCRVELVSE